MEFFKFRRNEMQALGGNDIIKISPSHAISDKEYLIKTIQEAEDDKLKQMERQIETLKAENLEMKKTMEDMISTLETYDGLISNLVKERETLKEQKATALSHLANLEIAFSDVHTKYERAKSIVAGFKENEIALLNSLQKNKEAIENTKKMYDELKDHATAQLNNANDELAKIKKNHTTEIARLKGIITRTELKVASLEQTLEQKNKENDKLSSMCDDLLKTKDHIKDN